MPENVFPCINIVLKPGKPQETGGEGTDEAIEDLCKTDWSIASPDAGTVIQVKLSDTGKLTYTVTQDETVILEESEMGLNTSVGDFTSGLTYKKEVFERCGCFMPDFLIAGFSIWQIPGRNWGCIHAPEFLKRTFCAFYPVYFHPAISKSKHETKRTVKILPSDVRHCYHVWKG